MDYRNAEYTRDGRITCEIDHPVLGWIAFTADPDDVEPLGRHLFAAITEAGGIADAPEPAPPPVPQVVSAFQAKEALIEAGLYDDAEAAVTAAGGRALRAWQNATEFQRGSETIAALAGPDGLNLTDAQIDDLFRAAAHITA
ncbi:hypothetical protein [Citreimonas sp.]|uniref:hypothetical protein n=1 Tax=Citreimonas sp. TaxID=3036715 RepID=UPI004059E774